MVNYNDVKDLSVLELQNLATNYLKEGLPDDALRLASLALEKDVDNAQTLFVIGNIYLDTDKSPIAEVIFRKALELDPSLRERLP